ncbi:MULTISPECIES: sugar ABC transporter ATP-binding protein [Pseudonocardia]|jgi:ribose transport system ATP-binding protein|uniref:Monosaccharide-transporting ATPase n=2 Tax=Pseudonocardia TaxID=1847 RepID=F4CTA7_PSEUX|nr:sugar ABC transporter ATP-binding protein [Pseudonocardia dioxanivorans]AEA26325.1 Monosaccharide-transporting ATPase [Pseudonocardia dioxanivorans CB1190]GJF03200.1 putative ribose/galactose/methyl galactoside import ATP-binding protein 3 [Pseudonocardia sp. D17]
MTNSTPLVRIRGLTKIFGGQRALDGVDLTIMPGEVHGLLGENGSGKSTLIKVLSGFHTPDGGTLEVAGRDVPLPLLPGQHRSLGFDFVHQDLGLVPSLSVTENLMLGEIASSRKVAYSWRAARERAAAMFARYDVDIDPDATVERIRPVDRAMLAIVRAVESIRAGAAAEGEAGANMLVLDEPTVFLPKQEVGQLFSLVRRITSDGSSVLFVSHDLDEVREITDRVTVLRDGRTSGTAVTKEISGRELVTMIIGRELAEHPHDAHAATTVGRDVVLSVRNLSHGPLQDVSFDLHEGEVLGFAGLVGSGYEEVVYSLFGASPGATGTISSGERTIDIASLTPRRAMSLGMALVPGDRKNSGSVATLSLGENMNLTVLDRYFRGWRLRHGTMRDNVRQLVTEFDVRPAVPDLEYGSFSGGNQQKALMAKWQQTNPKVLLLHEPTQGVDVGARQQIFDMIRGSTATSATICASSEYEQLETICDRVGIFVRGRLVTFVTGADITKARIADLCHGQASAPVPAP